MTNERQFTVSRRKVLAGLGTIGIASAGAGLGTTALFSDEESVKAKFQAGRVDLLVDYRSTYKTWLKPEEMDGLVYGNYMPLPGYDGEYVVAQAPDLRYKDDGSVISNEDWQDITKNVLDACLLKNDRYNQGYDFAELNRQLGASTDHSDVKVISGGPNYLGIIGRPYVDADAPQMMFKLTDVKPKDEGETTISLHLCDNPAIIKLAADEDADDENYVLEPEGLDDYTDGELDDMMYVKLWADIDCSNTHDSDEYVLFEGTLGRFLDEFDTATVLDGKQFGTGRDDVCFTKGVHCVGFKWYFPCFEDGDAESLGSDKDSYANFKEEVAYRVYGDKTHAVDVNKAQSDKSVFTLAFTAEQCRHQMLCTPKKHDLSTGVADWQVMYGNTAYESAQTATNPTVSWYDPADHSGEHNGEECTATWINKSGYESTAGSYTYSVDFDVTAADLAQGTCMLRTHVGVDNDMTIKLDGTSFGSLGGTTTDNFTQLHDFDVEVTTPGTHTLTVEVSNESGPTGLLVCATLECDCSKAF